MQRTTSLDLILPSGEDYVNVDEQISGNFQKIDDGFGELNSKFASGEITSGTLAVGSTTISNISYGKTFASAPVVVVTFRSYSSNSSKQQVFVQQIDESTSSFDIVMHNATTDSISLSANRKISWVAIGN